tara:strand:- start:3572 stop:4711 length:1140 start_codon:yes stop_codon:yes gene_type:complete
MNAKTKKIKPELMSLLIAIKDGTYRNEKSCLGLNILEVEKLALQMMERDGLTFEDLEKIHKEEKSKKDNTPFAFTEARFNYYVKDACKVEAEILRKKVETFSQKKNDITHYGYKLKDLYHRIGTSLIAIGYNDPTEYKRSIMAYNADFVKLVANLIEIEKRKAAKLFVLNEEDITFNHVPTISNNIEELMALFVDAGIMSRRPLRHIPFSGYERKFNAETIKQKYQEKLDTLESVKRSEKWHSVRDVVKDIACVYLKIYLKQIQRDNLNLKYLIEFHKLRAATYISDDNLRSVYTVTFNELGMDSKEIQLKFHHFIVVKLNQRYMKLKSLKEVTELEKIDSSYYEDKQDLKLILGNLQSFSTKFAKEELCFNAHDLDAL